MGGNLKDHFTNWVDFTNWDQFTNWVQFRELVQRPSTDLSYLLKGGGGTHLRRKLAMECWETKAHNVPSAAHQEGEEWVPLDDGVGRASEAEA